jgi:hypothetical protein
MEKLILRSVLYGADKIPDKWFEKIPGGFFKEKESQSKNTSKDSTPRSSRRHSTSEARRRRDDDYQDDGYRSEGERRRVNRRRRNRSSYDGGADDDDPYESDDERRRSTRDTKGRRRRSFDLDSRARDMQNGDRPRSGRLADDRNAYDDRDRPSSGRPSTGGSGPPPNPFSPNAYVPTVSPVAGGSPTVAPYPQSNMMPSPTANINPLQQPQPQLQQPPNSSAAARRYVPYSNIYGNSAQPSPIQTAFPTQQTNPQMPYSPAGSAPAVQSPAGYQQNPMAQQAPTAAAAGAGIQYNGQGGFVNSAFDPRRDSRDFERYAYKQDPSTARCSTLTDHTAVDPEISSMASNLTSTNNRVEV